MGLKPKARTKDAAVTSVIASAVVLLLDIVTLIVTVKKINKENN